MLSLLATVWMKYVSEPRVFMTGNPLLLLSVMLELMGIQFILMGLLGEVLSRTYFESQGKSPYSVRTCADPVAGRIASRMGATVIRADRFRQLKIKRNPLPLSFFLPTINMAPLQTGSALLFDIAAKGEVRSNASKALSDPPSLTVRYYGVI